MYLLDTNVVSELRRKRPHGAVLAWLESVSDADLHLSAVTIGELQGGVEMTREQNPGKAAEIEAWLEQVAETYNVLAMDAPAFRCWANSDRRRDDRGYGGSSQPHGGDAECPGLRGVRGSDLEPVRKGEELMIDRSRIHLAGTPGDARSSRPE